MLEKNIFGHNKNIYTIELNLIYFICIMKLIAAQKDLHRKTDYCHIHTSKQSKIKQFWSSSNFSDWKFFFVLINITWALVKELLWPLIIHIYIYIYICSIKLSEIGSLENGIPIIYWNSIAVNASQITVYRHHSFHFISITEQLFHLRKQ